MFCHKIHAWLIEVYCLNTLARMYSTEAQITNRTCACTMGSCDFSHVCSPTPNCTRENVALGKPANMSSFYTSVLPSGPACLAVNGNTDTVYKAAVTNENNPNCIHTQIDDKNAYWLVNLGRKYTIKNITVYLRSDEPRRMDLVEITVDDQECYTFSNGTTNNPPRKDVSCNTPRRGSVVKLYKNGANQPEYLLNFCEVQVWVCSDGFYGEGCNFSCRSNCRGDINCDNYYGTCLLGEQCSCSTGCNFTQSCTAVGNCQKDNVALGRPANMSSTWGPSEPSGPACVAVNGNTGTVYIPFVKGELNPNCIHTGLDDRNAWWLVNLGRNYTVTYITVYIRSELPRRMDLVEITVDDQECYKFSNGTTNNPPRKDVSCNIPRRGSVVKFYKNGVGQTEYLLNFCEVQVWVCKPGLYGINCENKCNCKDNEICDNVYGTCTKGCNGRFYGSNCTQICGNCKDNTPCDFQTGQCLNGCRIGWQEPMCNRICSSGNYGSDCNSTCGSCRDAAPCNASNGVCLGGCLDGFIEPLCKERCTEGVYGYNCSQHCGYCKDIISCNVSNGQCSTGCKDGWQEPMCVVCKSGFYGPQCLMCGNCRDSHRCNSTNGMCPTGCVDGYEPPLCNETCKNGLYGPSCNITCGFCNAYQPCNRENGTCVDGCADGYEPPDCTQKCPSGKWGRNCQKACGACLSWTCRHDNGICIKGCFSGYEGEQCTDFVQTTYVRDLSIVGSVLGAGLLISVSVIAVLIWRRRNALKDKRCHLPKSKDKEAHDTPKDIYAMENLNFHENEYDKFENQEEENKPYAELGEVSHGDHSKHSTTLDRNYEKLAAQNQNSSTDSKPYEII